MNKMNKVSVLTDFYRQAWNILEWYETLEPLKLSELAPDKESAKKVALFSADMIEDFCRPEGALGSPRIEAIIPNVVDVFTRLRDAGTEDFVLVEDAHTENAKEFGSYPPHGFKDTFGAGTIREIWYLEGVSMALVQKNCLSPIFSECENADLVKWCGTFIAYLEHLYQKGVRTMVVVGNCTDLCVRALADSSIRMWANSGDKDLRVIIPENCVQTFDLPADVAFGIGAKPHPGDMMHLLALYEMSRNGIDVVSEIL